MKQKFNFYFLKLAIILIVIYIIQVLVSGFTDMFVLNEKAINGEYYRFISAIFLHGGVTHLMYNLFALLFFGFILESLIGGKRFLVVFFISGILANIIAVNYYDSSLGASGAIYGILGAIAVIKPLMLVWAFGFFMPMFFAAVLWIMADVLRSLEVFGPTNVGSIAHLSGIIIGFILGIRFRSLKKKKRKNEFRYEIPESVMRNWEDNYMRR